MDSPRFKEVFGVEEGDDSHDASVDEGDAQRRSSVDEVYEPKPILTDSPKPALYELPEMLLGADNVRSLSELAVDGQVPLGSQLGARTPIRAPATPASGSKTDGSSDSKKIAKVVKISGAKDFGSFLNGVYHQVRGVSFNKASIFCSATVVPQSAPVFCRKNHLYIFYHKRNKAWVIGMKVNAGSGACAYILSKEASPDRYAKGELWQVSLENGGFMKQPSMVCASHQGDFLDPPEGFTLPAENGNTPPGRHEAEKMLKDRAGETGQTMGYFVLRESTSVPDAHVISILLDTRDIEHVIITGVATKLLAVDAQYMGERYADLEFPSLQNVIDHGKREGFIVRGQTVLLTTCVHGQDLLEG
eukprot:m.345105 g.345105  ORF g.345105 m.345105 type:complete len:360 (-) comp20654_c0_seq3:798-1877(-)